MREADVDGRGVGNGDAVAVLGEKLAYIANQWNWMLVFLFDGRVEMDSNFVENRIRPIALSRKNTLFAGHDEGVRGWGRIASLIYVEPPVMVS